jgi:hypothetical protein
MIRLTASRKKKKRENRNKRELYIYMGFDKDLMCKLLLALVSKAFLFPGTAGMMNIFVSVSQPLEPCNQQYPMSPSVSATWNVISDELVKI